MRATRSSARATDSDRVIAVDTTLFYRLPTDERSLAGRGQRALGRGRLDVAFHDNGDLHR